MKEVVDETRVGGNRREKREEREAYKLKERK